MSVGYLNSVVVLGVGAYQKIVIRACMLQLHRFASGISLTNQKREIGVRKRNYLQAV